MALSALDVRHQRANGRVPVPEGMRHDRFDIGELRNDLGRYERAGVDLAHAGGDDCVDQRAFDFGWDEHVQVLQAVARADLANVDVWRVTHRTDASRSIVILCNKEQSVELSVKSSARKCLVPATTTSQKRPRGNGEGSRRAEHMAGQILALARREGMQPGDRLIEQHLADALDLSRGPICLGLKALATAGLARARRIAASFSPRAQAAPPQSPRSLRSAAATRSMPRWPPIVSMAA